MPGVDVNLKALHNIATTANNVPLQEPVNHRGVIWKGRICRPLSEDEREQRKIRFQKISEALRKLPVDQQKVMSETLAKKKSLSSREAISIYENVSSIMGIDTPSSQGAVHLGGSQYYDRLLHIRYHEAGQKEVNGQLLKEICLPDGQLYLKGADGQILRPSGLQEADVPSSDFYAPEFIDWLKNLDDLMADGQITEQDYRIALEVSLNFADIEVQLPYMAEVISSMRHSWSSDDIIEFIGREVFLLTNAGLHTSLLKESGLNEEGIMELLRMAANNFKVQAGQEVKKGEAVRFVEHAFFRGCLDGSIDHMTAYLQKYDLQELSVHDQVSDAVHHLVKMNKGKLVSEEDVIKHLSLKVDADDVRAELKAPGIKAFIAFATGDEDFDLYPEIVSAMADLGYPLPRKEFIKQLADTLQVKPQEAQHILQNYLESHPDMKMHFES
ncbi:MAG: hypothetical protein ACR2PT_14200 [Endozoicomonas sp.]